MHINKTLLRRQAKASARLLLLKNLPLTFAITAIAVILPEIIMSEFSSKMFPSMEVSPEGFSAISLSMNVNVFDFLVFSGLALLAGAVFMPAFLGGIEYAQKLTRSHPVKFLDVFEWFSDGKRLLLALRYLPFALFIGALELLPYSAFLIFPKEFSFFAAGTYELSASEIIDVWRFTGLSILLMLVCSALRLLFVSMPYELVDRQEEGVISAFRRSVSMTRRHLWDFIVFYLSFVPFYLLVGLSCNIFMLIFAPYFFISKTVYIEWLRRIRAKDAGEIFPGDPPQDGTGI